MKHKFIPGQALVIVGPQGSGKSMMARAIASAYGRYSEVDINEIKTKRGLDEVLFSEPATVIVDGFFATSELGAWLSTKSVLASEKLAVKHYAATKEVKTPNFIFCTNDADFLPDPSGTRRFSVIVLDGKCQESVA